MKANNPITSLQDSDDSEGFMIDLYVGCIARLVRLTKMIAVLQHLQYLVAY